MKIAFFTAEKGVKGVLAEPLLRVISASHVLRGKVTFFSPQRKE